MTWWCEHGQGGIYARLVEQFEVVDESLRLRSPDSLDSWLGHGFDFKRLVARTLALLGAISLDTSRPGNERVPDLTMGPCPCVPISTLVHDLRDTWHYDGPFADLAPRLRAQAYL